MVVNLLVRLPKIYKESLYIDLAMKQHVIYIFSWSDNDKNNKNQKYNKYHQIKKITITILPCDKITKKCPAYKKLFYGNN